MSIASSAAAHEAAQTHLDFGAEIVVQPNSAWGGAWKVAATVAIVGLIATLVGYRVDAHRFAFSYLFAFFSLLTLALGSLFFVLIQHLTASGWSVGVRRAAELVLGGFPALPVLFLPVLLCAGELYEWYGDHSHAAAAGHAPAMHDVPSRHPTAAGAERSGHHGGASSKVVRAEHEDHAAGNTAHSPMEAALHHRLLAHKAGYLNSAFFKVRALVYFVAWLLLAFFYRRWSTLQDTTHHPELTVKMARWSPLALAVFGLTLTFSAVDWLMALEPTWYSTIFGVYVFAGSVVSALAFLIVFTLALRAQGYLGQAVNVEHYHDIGKLMFGFTCFWAYIGLSQMLLMWYAGIPEEATYYHRRWDDAGWRSVSILLMVGHFGLPFLFMISRVVKRRLPWLRFAALWMLAMHFVDIYWFVMPYASTGLSLHWLDAACFLWVGGGFFALVFRRMLGTNLVPVGDPRLPRALHFHNA